MINKPQSIETTVNGEQTNSEKAVDNLFLSIMKAKGIEPEGMCGGSVPASLCCIELR